MDRQWNDKIFNVDRAGFSAVALEVFDFQYRENSVYHAYCDLIGRNPSNVSRINSIPFLPISFFKSHEVTTTRFTPETIFKSSGTTGSVNSRHLVRQKSLYEESFVRGFERAYGNIRNLVIIGLLPSYLERTDSSLVYMVDHLIRLSGRPESGFYLHDTDRLAEQLAGLEKRRQPTLLIGVTFALIDFALAHPMPLSSTIVMETGGMKGRRREMIRAEVQQVLADAFSLNTVHSEYGMTELLSQAYSSRSGLFQTPPWMKVLVRDDEDPLDVHTMPEDENPLDVHIMPVDQDPVDLRILPDADAAMNVRTLPEDEVARETDNAPRKTSRRRKSISGGINIIDLANIYSVSFIATDDAARLHEHGSFEVLGRLDNSDLRGCSLLTI